MGVAAKVAAATPVPERAMSTGVLDPLMVSERVPLLVLAAVGANCTPKVLLWFDAKVNGRVSPVKLNPAPDTVAAETVRFPPPVFFKVSVCDWLDPTCTFPKVKLVGAVVRLLLGTEVPERAILSGLADPSLATAKVSPMVPADLGLKVIWKVVLWP